jgi:hypothetical protein
MATSEVVKVAVFEGLGLQPHPGYDLEGTVTMLNVEATHRTFN